MGLKKQKQTQQVPRSTSASQIDENKQTYSF